MTNLDAPDANNPYPAEVYRQELSVPFDYPVYFAQQVFAPDNPLLADVLDRRREGRRHRAAVYVDAGLAHAQPGLIDRIKEYFHARPGLLELADPPQIVPGGEVAKNGWGPVRDVMWTLGNLHMDRQSFVIAIGGGAMLDMVGFAASLVHRGLRLVRLPSTVLAQNDAGVGVKNGMDEHGVKNFVGTFAPPFAVINDSSFLPTLADRDWSGGIAEAFKVAIIKDAAFFDFLATHAPALRRRDLGAMEQLIRRCAILHLDHIRSGGDPFELGSARPLDFGHWLAHKLETMSAYRLGHGQAVAVGIAVDSWYASNQGLISPPELERILTGLTACGLPIWDECLSRRAASGALEALEGLEQFREHLGGILCITLPHGIGRRIEVHQMNPAVIEEAAEFLRSRSGERVNPL